jgi:signal transduction histidine kinase
MNVGLLASELSDNMTLVALTAIGAAPVVLLGSYLTRRRGGAPVSRQVLVVALAPLVATWVGAVVAARAMFIDSHDLTAFGVIACTAGLIGVIAAWRMARRIRVDTDALGALSRSIADGHVPDAGPEASVSELGRLGEQLSDMSRRLGEAHERELALERSRRELVAWVSHDLRSPLASIRATAEALEDGVVDAPDDVHRYLHSIGVETDRLTLLVDDLFELSRITSGVIELRPETVEVAGLVGNVLDSARATARARGVELRAEVPEQLSLLVSRAEATRVVRNLVDNAVRHTPERGTVRIQVDRSADQAVVSVIDECGGIPGEDLERVFDVAFRGDAARGRDDGGGGLGLAIAKGLVEAQAGSIAVSNHPGGCCFAVRFPLAEVADDVDRGAS